MVVECLEFVCKFIEGSDDGAKVESNGNGLGGGGVDGRSLSDSGAFGSVLEGGCTGVKGLDDDDNDGGTVGHGLDADGTIGNGFCVGGMVGKVWSDGGAVCIVIVCCWISFSSSSLLVFLRRLLVSLSANVFNLSESGSVDFFVGWVFLFVV